MPTYSLNRIIPASGLAGMTVSNQKKKAHTNVNNHAIVLAVSRNIINFAPNFNIKHSLFRFRLYPCQIKPQEQRGQM
jgi:hypothetical protein